jgi:hypothetical protein
MLEISGQMVTEKHKMNALKDPAMRSLSTKLEDDVEIQNNKIHCQEQKEHSSLYSHT